MSVIQRLEKLIEQWEKAPKATPHGYIEDIEDLLDEEAGWLEDAIEEVDYQWYRWTSATTPVDQASCLVDLANRMSDLRTWHSSFDLDSGTLGWEREDNEFNETDDDEADASGQGEGQLSRS